ncbi:MAG: dihydrolipoamide acetyltransferase family protein [Bacillota bacterium]|nr:dihydrolipoamide acetyltransferase family protein [Bacillota bacterium]
MFHVKFADIGEGIHEGVLLKMFFNKGDKVEDGDSLFTLETDKVNAEIPSPVSGTLSDIRFKVGDKVNVGQVIVVVDDGEPGLRSNMKEGEELSEASGEASGEATTAPVPEEPEKTTTIPETTHLESVEEAGSTSVVGQIEVSSDMIESSGEGFEAAEEESVSTKILATPVARKMAKDLGVDIQKIKGTGPQGRVMKADISAAADQSATEKQTTEKSKDQAPLRQSTPKQPIPEMDQTERIPMTMLRKTIANNMTLSKFTIPHTAVMDEADVTELVAFRTKVKALAAEKGVKLTYLAFFIKAVVNGLKAYPYMNASLDETSDEIVLKHFFNIGIAVDTPEGLMVPVIKNADKLSLFEIADAIEDLTTRARDHSLKLDDLSNGSFTITNYGAVGASFGVPIIKYPEAGILGVGAIVKKPVVIDDEIVIRQILPLSLSFDHRIIDGADAGRFVMTVKELLMNPELLLLN